MKDRDSDQEIRQLDKLAQQVEKMNLGDYIHYLNSPWRIIWINVLIGVSRGVGLTLGATLVIAMLFKLIGMLIEMNIPYLTELLQNIVRVVQSTPHL